MARKIKVNVNDESLLNLQNFYLYRLKTNTYNHFSQVFQTFPKKMNALIICLKDKKKDTIASVPFFNNGQDDKI